MAETDDEIDFEYDAEDLPDEAPVAAELGSPSLIVENLHVKYRVFGAKRTGPVGPDGKPSIYNRLRFRMQGHVGAVSEVHAVKGISFVARRGESIGIVGTNGSGKSTLLRAAAGLLPPASGSVWVDAKPSLLGVNAALLPQLTGERNIIIGGLALGLSPEEIRERYDEVVEFAGIGDFVNLPMKTYSSGMAARLRFAISSVARPEILMIDEALATGDADFRQRSKARIDEIRQQAGTIFLVSHSLDAINRMCSRVLWLDHGEVVADGDPESITADYRKHVQEVRARKKSAREERQAAGRSAEQQQSMRESPFRDVPADSDFATEIAWLHENGITSGWKDGTFRPAEDIQRQAIASFLFSFAQRAEHGFERSDTPPATLGLPDVPEDHRFITEIAWLVGDGIASGYTDGTFRPESPVTREAMAAFLYRLAGEPEWEAPEVSPFSDLGVDEGFYHQITWLAATGITSGYRDGTFRPRAKMSREAAAAFLYRFAERFDSPGTARD